MMIQKTSKPFLVMKDPPSCDFLKENIAAERAAVEHYMEESNRTDDVLSKRVFHAIAEQEMLHLELLDSINTQLGCPKTKP